MPNYDYECQKCGDRFEVFQSMNDAKLSLCRVDGCGGELKRLLGTGGGIIFKGSGFYQTDYGPRLIRPEPRPMVVAPPRRRRSPAIELIRAQGLAETINALMRYYAVT